MRVGVYEAFGTRPLNITNCDNRIINNAVRFRIEPSLDQHLSRAQRGFVGGRSLLSNVIDIDERMIASVLAK